MNCLKLKTPSDKSYFCNWMRQIKALPFALGNACYGQPCQNGGTCSLDSSVKGYNCRCISGYDQTSDCRNRKRLMYYLKLLFFFKSKTVIIHLYIYDNEKYILSTKIKHKSIKIQMCEYKSSGGYSLSTSQPNISWPLRKINDIHIVVNKILFFLIAKYLTFTIYVSRSLYYTKASVLESVVKDFLMHYKFVFMNRNQLLQQQSMSTRSYVQLCLKWVHMHLSTGI